MTNKKKALIRIKGLTKSYNGESLSILHDISLDIYEGEILGIIGESGSGKTTFLRSIVCLERPDSGKVEYKGVDLLKLNREEQRKKIRTDLRYVYQHPEASLNPGVSIGKTLENTIRLTNPESATTECDDYLRLVGLPVSYASKYPHELSGGEKRRAVLARALITKPRAIFADEPFSGLDKILQTRLIESFVSIKRAQNLTYVLVSHDQTIIKHLSDRVLMLKEGKLHDYDF